MKFLVLFALVAVCSAQNYWYSSPVALSGYPWAARSWGAVPYTAAVAPAVVPSIAASKYHAQDVLGQASFGHIEPFQSRAEVRDLTGDVRGSYSYVDPNGKVNVVEYSAGRGGFRVLGANNLPEAPAVPVTPMLKAPEPVMDTPEVMAARAEFSRKFEEAKMGKMPMEMMAEKKEETVMSRQRRGVLLPYASPAFLPTLAKSTIKYNTFEAVDAAVPASTRKLELKEKEQEILTPAISYTGLPTLRYIAEEKPIEGKTMIKTLATPIAYNWGGLAYNPYWW